MSYDDLSKMTIHELNVLRISNYIESDIQASGTVSIMQYISEDEADGIAYSDADLVSASVINSSAQIDCRDVARKCDRDADPMQNATRLDRWQGRL